MIVLPAHYIPFPSATNFGVSRQDLLTRRTNMRCDQNLLTENTTFTHDVIGRYTANTWGEALCSMNRVDARPFDTIIIGGGTFGSALAQQLLYRDKKKSHRILVLEAGRFL